MPKNPGMDLDTPGGVAAALEVLEERAKNIADAAERFHLDVEAAAAEQARQDIDVPDLTS